MPSRRIRADMIILGLICFLLSVTTVSCCPNDTWIRSNVSDRCYLLSSYKTNYAQAISVCKGFKYGCQKGNLASVPSLEYWQEILQGVMGGTPINTWIGLYDTTQSASKDRTDWGWEDGTPYNQTWHAWEDGEPGGANAENCARIKENFLWSGKACTRNYNFLCQLGIPATNNLFKEQLFNSQPARGLLHEEKLRLATGSTDECSVWCLAQDWCEGFQFDQDSGLCYLLCQNDTFANQNIKLFVVTK